MKIKIRIITSEIFKTRSKLKVNKSENTNKDNDDKNNNDENNDGKVSKRCGFSFVNEVKRQEDCNQIRQSSSWTIDSEATCHMTRNTLPKTDNQEDI